MCIRDSVSVASLQDRLRVHCSDDLRQVLYLRALCGRHLALLLQALLSSLPLVELSREVTRIAMLEPVSYTHLDVYKRQDRAHDDGTTAQGVLPPRLDDRQQYASSHVGATGGLPA